MATYFARKAGNINAVDVWSTTPTGTASDLFSSFTNNDTLMSNSFVVTINVNTTVLEVKNDTTGGATTGGGFTLNNGITLNANIYAGSANCVTFSANSPSVATINGNIYGPPTSINIGGVVVTGTGTLNIIGSLIGGSVQSSAVYLNANGIINVTGSITGGGGGNCMGIYNQSSTGTINITGSVTGGTVAAGVGAYSGSTTGAINITGNVTANVGPGANNSSTGTITITGTVTGYLSAGAVNSSTGTLTATRAKGNGFGNGSVGLTAQVGVSASQNGLTRVYEIEYGDLGQSPTSGPVVFIDDTSNKALFYRPGLTKKTLVDSAATLDLPATNNVRNGTTYNFGSNTGTCVIPSANSVAYGVGVDNTTGTATLTPQSIWDILINNINTNNSIGERLKNSATIDSVSTQVTTIKGS